MATHRHRFGETGKVSAKTVSREKDLFYALSDSPVGEIMLAGDSTHLYYLDFPLHGNLPNPDSSWARDQLRFESELQQLEEYFSGERETFDIPMKLLGSDYEISVWEALQNIAFGTVKTYGDVAKAIGQPEGAQAIGNANGKNPIPIIVPCHRVIAAKNNIGGFTGGVEKKQFLLQLEKAKNVQFNLL